MAKDFDVDCPDCGSAVGVTIEDVAKQKTVRCRRGHSVKLLDEGGGAAKVKRMLDDFGK